MTAAHLSSTDSRHGSPTLSSTRPENVSAIEERTGTQWDDWLSWLTDRGASEKTHTDIARMIAAHLESTLENPGWWAQSITVAYEQHIGRRRPGQNCEGQYQVSVSKTAPLELEETVQLLTRHLEYLAGSQNQLDGVRLEGPLRSSHSENWRYLKASLSDGSRVSITMTAKEAGKDGKPKTGIGVGHEKLKDESEIERWRAFWRHALNSMPLCS